MNENAMPQTKREAINYFSDAGRCHDFMVNLRWSGKPVCAHCKSENIGKLSVSEKKVKRIVKGVEIEKILTRRVWNCKSCKKQFTVKVGTIFEDSPIGLELWLPCVWMVVNAKNGVSSCELGRDLGVMQRTAWFMAHRIRAALHNGNFEKFSGGVEADESFLGGKARNMHKDKRAIKVKGTGGVSMTPVMGLLERSTRKNASRVILKVLNTRRRTELHRHIKNHVAKGANLLTDAFRSYRGLENDYAHEFIDHAVTYAKGHVHTNGLENFWSLLKRTLKGTYVHCESFHLFRYLDEQAYRFNERELNDSNRFLNALRGVSNRRLTYGELTGKTA
jgi:transposase-like protein